MLIGDIKNGMPKQAERESGIDVGENLILLVQLAELARDPACSNVTPRGNCWFRASSLLIEDDGPTGIATLRDFAGSRYCIARNW